MLLISDVKNFNKALSQKFVDYGRIRFNLDTASKVAA